MKHELFASVSKFYRKKEPFNYVKAINAWVDQTDGYRDAVKIDQIVYSYYKSIDVAYKYKIQVKIYLRTCILMFIFHFYPYCTRCYAPPLLLKSFLGSTSVQMDYSLRY